MPFKSGSMARAALAMAAVVGFSGLAACTHHGSAAPKTAVAPNAIGVNSYLWRATLDTRLRGDALKVTVFKEVSNGQGGWVASQAADQTSIDIENAILTRARQLRVSNLKG